MTPKKKGPNRQPGPKPKGYKHWRGTPITLRRVILARDGGRCRYCGAPTTQLDHVKPYYHGGKTVAENLVAACFPCNTRKRICGDFTLQPANILCYRDSLIAEDGALFGMDLWAVVSEARNTERL